MTADSIDDVILSMFKTRDVDKSDKDDFDDIDRWISKDGGEGTERDNERISKALRGDSDDDGEKQQYGRSYDYGRSKHKEERNWRKKKGVKLRPGYYDIDEGGRALLDAKYGLARQRAEANKIKKEKDKERKKKRDAKKRDDKGIEIRDDTKDEKKDDDIELVEVGTEKRKKLQDILTTDYGLDPARYWDEYKRNEMTRFNDTVVKIRIKCVIEEIDEEKILGTKAEIFIEDDGVLKKMNRDEFSYEAYYDVFDTLFICKFLESLRLEEDEELGYYIDVGYFACLRLYNACEVVKNIVVRSSKKRELTKVGTKSGELNYAEGDVEFDERMDMEGERIMAKARSLLKDFNTDEERINEINLWEMKESKTLMTSYYTYSDNAVDCCNSEGDKGIWLKDSVGRRLLRWRVNKDEGILGRVDVIMLLSDLELYINESKRWNRNKTYYIFCRTYVVEGRNFKETWTELLYIKKYYRDIIFYNALEEETSRCKWASGYVFALRNFLIQRGNAELNIRVVPNTMQMLYLGRIINEQAEIEYRKREEVKREKKYKINKESDEKYLYDEVRDEEIETGLEREAIKKDSDTDVWEVGICSLIIEAKSIQGMGICGMLGKNVGMNTHCYRLSSWSRDVLDRITRTLIYIYGGFLDDMMLRRIFIMKWDDKVKISSSRKFNYYVDYPGWSDVKFMKRKVDMNREGRLGYIGLEGYFAFNNESLENVDRPAFLSFVSDCLSEAERMRKKKTEVVNDMTPGNKTASARCIIFSRLEPDREWKTDKREYNEWKKQRILILDKRRSNYTEFETKCRIIDAKEELQGCYGFDYVVVNVGQCYITALDVINSPYVFFKLIEQQHKKCGLIIVVSINFYENEERAYLKKTLHYIQNLAAYMSILFKRCSIVGDSYLSNVDLGVKKGLPCLALICARPDLQRVSVLEDAIEESEKYKNNEHIVYTDMSGAITNALSKFGQQLYWMKKYGKDSIIRGDVMSVSDGMSSEDDKKGVWMYLGRRSISSYLMNEARKCMGGVVIFLNPDGSMIKALGEGKFGEVQRFVYLSEEYKDKLRDEDNEELKWFEKTLREKGKINVLRNFDEIKFLEILKYTTSEIVTIICGMDSGICTLDFDFIRKGIRETNMVGKQINLYRMVAVHERLMDAVKKFGVTYTEKEFFIEKSKQRVHKVEVECAKIDKLYGKPIYKQVVWYTVENEIKGSKIDKDTLRKIIHNAYAGSHFGSRVGLKYAIYAERVGSFCLLMHDSY